MAFATMFLNHAEDRHRLPVAIVSGFLGSGKTTLLNALLRRQSMAGTAVAVNEFGEIPLDQHLIEHGADSTVVLANGCLCCNLAGDMEDAVLRVFRRREQGDIPNFRRMLIEPSGLADPAPIAQAILRNPVMSRVFRLDAIVATVDAVFATAQLARHAETRKQVALADRLVITKDDMAAPAELAALPGLLRRHNPLAPILRAEHGDIDPAALFPQRFLDPASSGSPPAVRRSALFADSLDPVAHESTTHAVVLSADAPLDWRAYDAWLRRIRLAHGENLLRVKAMLNVAGAAGPVVVHGVHHVLHTPIELARWPDADRRSRTVLITQGVPTEELRASWQSALPGLAAPSIMAR